LVEREREVINRRFGFNGNDEQTLRKIGIKFGLSRERIRQIQNDALKKMRNRYEDIIEGSLESVL
jgi:DNA-directed RNA polymerase sigma subunit (sigma70/sigma32)